MNDKKKIEYLEKRLELVETVIANFLFEANATSKAFDEDQEELIKEFEDNATSNVSDPFADIDIVDQKLNKL